MLASSVNCWSLVKNAFEPSFEAPANDALRQFALSLTSFTQGSSLHPGYGAAAENAEGSETPPVRDSPPRAKTSPTGTATPAFTPVPPSGHSPTVKYTVSPSADVSPGFFAFAPEPSSVPHLLIRSVLPKPPLTPTSTG